jgi:uncharacterized protein involved in exopolysaccharide biosynthesis
MNENVIDGSAIPADSDPGIGLLLRPHRRRIAVLSLLAGVLGYVAALFIPPTFTARMTFLSPQPQQSSAASALASLGALSGLAGAAAVKSSADQYVSLMQSATVSDRIVDRFKLMAVYDTTLRVDARKKLQERVRIVAGKKDGLISVDVDDHDPDRAAAIANDYLQELKSLSNGLALTEAQQRRQFFERQLEQTRDRLAEAQRKLEASGFNAGALKSEPKAAADTYVRVKAEAAATEVRLQALRQGLTEQAPQVQRELATLAGLRAQLASMEQPLSKPGDQDYIGAYRDFKYQDTLFEVYARQFELAKLDEAKEGALFQVVDPATRPEKRSAPKRSFIGAGVMLVAAFSLCAWFVFRERRRHSSDEPAGI